MDPSEDLQRALDSQWEALDARSDTIHSARRSIGEAMVNLARAQEHALDELNEQSLHAREAHSRIMELEKEVERLGTELDRLTGPESPFVLDEQKLQAQLRDIDKQVEQLQVQRSAVQTALSRARSTSGARTAAVKEALEGARKRRSLLPDEVAPEELEKQHASLSRELNAARAGLDLWGAVVDVLAELDESLDKGVSPRDALQRGIDRLESAKMTAAQNGWKALVVAIEHELEPVNEAFEGLA